MMDDGLRHPAHARRNDRLAGRRGLQRHAAERLRPDRGLDDDVPPARRSPAISACGRDPRSRTGAASPARRHPPRRSTRPGMRRATARAASTNTGNPLPSDSLPGVQHQRPVGQAEVRAPERRRGRSRRRRACCRRRARGPDGSAPRPRRCRARPGSRRRRRPRAARRGPSAARPRTARRPRPARGAAAARRPRCSDRDRPARTRAGASTTRSRAGRRPRTERHVVIGQMSP